MPLPLLAVPAVLLAGYGVKKGYDAKKDFDKAKQINKDAQSLYNKAERRLNQKRISTNRNIEKLGKLKIDIYEHSLLEFVETFSKIKNVDFKNNIELGTKVDVDYGAMLKMKESVLEIKDMLGGGLAALGSGAAAGFGALGGVGMLATASTGTAIGTLSGAAATNATLAWLGGGALSAGGFGMAGGMVVLGGVVAAPVLAVGGFVLATKAEKAKIDATSNMKKAKAAVKSMRSAEVVLDGINKRVNEFHYVLLPLDKVFRKYIQKMQRIVRQSDDYAIYSDSEKDTIMIVASIAQTIKNVCDVPIIDKNGSVTKASQKVMETATDFMKKIDSI
jgi:hypothetical protein